MAPLFRGVVVSTVTRVFVVVVVVVPTVSVSSSSELDSSMGLSGEICSGAAARTASFSSFVNSIDDGVTSEIATKQDRQLLPLRIHEKACHN